MEIKRFGRFVGASANADDCINSFRRAALALVAARQVLDPANSGQANRLADFAREAQGVLNNMVHFLEEAGKGQ